MSEPLALRPRTSALRCAICHGDFTTGLTCPRCSARFHWECVDQLGRCPSLGCHAKIRTTAPPSGCINLSTVLVATILTTIFVLIAIPQWLEARKHGNELEAINALKTIANKEAIFREGDADKDGNLDYGMLSELNDAKLVDELLGIGTKAGYFFQATYSFSTSEFLWFAAANPVIPHATGDRYFQTNQAGVIFYGQADERPALDTNSCTLPNNGILPTDK